MRQKMEWSERVQVAAEVIGLLVFSICTIQLAIQLVTWLWQHAGSGL